MADEYPGVQKRLFFALDCPPQQRKAISQWRKSLDLRSGRPVAAENYHLTLLFLGAVDVAQIDSICCAASKVRVPGFALSVMLDRLQVWRNSAALVLESESTVPALLRLSYALEQAMLPLGFGQSGKAFRPHLTLIRDYRLTVPEASAPPEFHFRADHFTLYESHSGRYRALAEWPLIAA